MKKIMVLLLVLLIPSGAIALKKVKEVQVIDSTGKKLGTGQVVDANIVGVLLEHRGTGFVVGVAEDFIFGAAALVFETTDCTEDAFFLEGFEPSFAIPGFHQTVAVAPPPPGFTVYVPTATVEPVTPQSIFFPSSCNPIDIGTVSLPGAEPLVVLPFTPPFTAKVKTTGKSIK